TIEDPIEYALPGTTQIQTNAEVGLTFANGLRSILRQDPNIIMVGEIRDKETAEMAIRSSLTGHLVLSSVHTNSASLTITRLVDMGVEPFMISSSLLTVLSQRLARRICPSCKEEYRPDENLVREFLGRSIDPRTIKFYRGRGCPECRSSGYKGRMALAEVIPITPAIRDLIMARAQANEIEAKAVEEGMVSLRRDGIAKVNAGLTTIDEVIKETVAEE
ncbi:MAG TPA: ATPase, T2SS/T4P/T4SS family, partial [Candidatus Edwardsbacteria bacterium]|nr:ATPase, T2SS/T4P/T4SS family [Candidatus Edwardsbacteria bacterium]